MPTFWRALPGLPYPSEVMKTGAGTAPGAASDVLVLICTTCTSQGASSCELS